MATASEEHLAQEAAEYLRETNFKTLCEWLTAEVSVLTPRRTCLRLRCCRSQALFARPRDPLAHIASIVQSKLDARPSGASFAPSEPDSLLASTYSSPPPQSSPASEGTASKGVLSRLSAVERSKVLLGILEASSAIASELDPHKATGNIVQHAAKGEGVARWARSLR
jgi:hypothetical protein